MNKIILIVVILTNLIILSCSKTKEADITYIANCGFMIQGNDNKIMIDALFNKGFSHYLVAHDSVSARIINGRPPFDNATLLLVTHSDNDHFNDSLVIEYLLNNKNNRLVGPKSVTNQLLNTALGKNVSNQIIEIDSFGNYQIDTVIHDLRIKSFFMQHDKRVSFENIGYVITINGVKVFHTGDYTQDETDKFEKLQLQNENIDLALLNFYGFWSKKADRDFTKRTINPKNIVLMHISVDEIDCVKDSVNKIEDFIDI